MGCSHNYDKMQEVILYCRSIKCNNYLYGISYCIIYCVLYIILYFAFFIEKNIYVIVATKHWKKRMEIGFRLAQNQLIGSDGAMVVFMLSALLCEP